MANEEAAKKMIILFDDEGDDKIDGTQIGTVARALGLKPTEAMVEKAAGKKYKKGEARITIAEFWPIFEALKKEKDVGTFNDYCEALKVFDKEENGKITLPELKHALIGLGERLTKDQAEEITDGVADPEKMVKYQDFVKKVLAGPNPPKEE
jgi:Ca2+-binding EF-hand superfamily protein